MTDSNCIFCKIANGDIPSATIYEDDLFRVILDISPAMKGHALILPKNHCHDLTDIEEATAAKALLVASKVEKAMMKVLSCDGVNLLQNTGAAAGQSVFHLHFHLIPRYENDSVTIPWTTLSYADGEANELAAKLKAAL
ncbi:MAG: HIT family protein [Lachnospiraceae bacterium]|nr:HIT family protein [Lachnospiraceae bacterium]